MSNYANWYDEMQGVKLAESRKRREDDYLRTREMFRDKGERAEKRGDIEEATYCAGVVRGLDLAFQDGTAKN